jgi:hypothetical protein
LFEQARGGASASALASHGAAREAEPSSCPAWAQQPLAALRACACDHQQRLDGQRACLIKPESNFRRRWDAISCVLIVFIAFTLPYRIAFVEDDFLAWRFIDFAIDLHFLADLVVNVRRTRYSNGARCCRLSSHTFASRPSQFRTMYRDHQGELVASPSAIALRYARGGLLIDLASSVPFEWCASLDVT